jgi:chemotaxis protein methyltransferase CheR
MDVVLRQRLRQLATERLGLAATALPDARVDAALERMSLDGPSPAQHLDALASLASDAPAWQPVIEALVVGETSFFRHTAWFLQLERRVLKPLIDTCRETGVKRLRIWSAACATGEEAYSIAIILDRLLQRFGDWDIRIIGTDVNAAFVAAARVARYRAWSLRELDANTRLRYFQKTGDGRFELVPEIRAMVSFETLNLVDAPPHDGPDIAECDLIICRNVLMYLSPESQRAVADRLAGNLALHGWLAVTPVEAEPDWFRSLERVNVPSAIFFRRDMRSTVGATN